MLQLHTLHILKALVHERHQLAVLSMLLDMQRSLQWVLEGHTALWETAAATSMTLEIHHAILPGCSW